MVVLSKSVFGMVSVAFTILRDGTRPVPTILSIGNAYVFPNLYVPKNVPKAHFIYDLDGIYWAKAAVVF